MNALSALADALASVAKNFRFYTTLTGTGTAQTLFALYFAKAEAGRAYNGHAC